MAVPGFADGHAHLLQDSAGIPLTVEPRRVRAFHREVAAAGSTPMDVPEPLPARPLSWLAGRLRAGLARAAAAGLTEVTEMGMRDWRYLDALDDPAGAGPLPARLRRLPGQRPGRRAIAGRAGRPAGRPATAPGSGWRGSSSTPTAGSARGPARCAGTSPTPGTRGLLFLDGPALARRIAPLAEAGWRIATHAIGDRAVAAVLDGYELAWDGDRAAMAAARPRIEHASLLSADLIARMAEPG